MLVLNSIRVKANLYCMLFNRAIKSLYYANRGIPKSISILLIELGCMNTNHVA